MTDTMQDPFATPTEAAEPSPPAQPHAKPDYASLSLPKIMLLAGLAMAAILPNMFISNLIEEREAREAGVRQEFTRNWGPEQAVLGPVLVIPYQAGERPRTYVRIAAAKLDLAATLFRSAGCVPGRFPKGLPFLKERLDFLADAGNSKLKIGFAAP